uniref:NADH-ubiquinone oxidoreductase chain 6 n=1 Tax=Engaewa subcoerulea TaxID=99762 RepID=A0A0Y0I897_9EUCA|nr:NADH dehydrogenase subunit 6 [Engaewa subcoerulea]AMB27349.1 NADH dehydrogenase subunit 6 [Engaewa subcoerulea]
MNILYFSFPLIFSISLLFTRMTHPLSMGVALLTQTLLVCISTGASNSCFWFSYILFLIFMGAMLILFIYVASLASNESFKIHPISGGLLVASLSVSLILLVTDPLSLAPNFSSLSSNTFFTEKNISSLTSTNMIYSPHTSPLTLFLIVYLLFSFLAVMKIINFTQAPLRPNKTP